jgi:uncharacterized membrane protein
MYLAFKLLHIISSTVLFGTGIGTAFQMWMAHRSADTRAIATVAASVVRADFWFTTPAVIIQPLTGIILLRLAGYDPFAPWLVAAYVLYGVTGACWLPVVWIQMRLARLSAAAGNGPLPDSYHRLFRLWFALGWPAFAAVLGIFWLMVEKPG